MANKEQTYTIKIDAELSSLQDKVAKARQSLDGLLSSGKAPKGLASSFEKLEGLIGRISDKSKQAPSKSLFSGVGKDLSNVELLFGEIIRSLDSLKDASKDVKLELFPPESRTQLQAAIKGLKEYQEILERIKEKEVGVESARKVSEKTAKTAAELKQDKKDTKRALEKKQTKKESLQGQITALEIDPEKNAVKIAKLKGEISELDLEIKNLTSDYNAAAKALTEANRAAEEAKTKYEGLSKELSDLELDGLNALSISAQKAGRVIETIDGETPRKKMERLNNTMQSFIDDSLVGLPEGVQRAKVSMSNYSEVITEATQKTHSAKEANDEYQEGLAERKAFEQRIKDFLGLAGATHLFRQALRDAMQTITELDTTMTEMSVVTNLDVSDYWDQLPQYTERANKLGLAINDVYKADTLFYQQGLKTNEVVAISTETMKMAKIAGLDTAEATDRMTAALRGFNMELNETSAAKIADVYSELAAITAADVDEISTAMTKTASIASSAGMEFETTAAFLSQIIETTRESAETAGTAMKTVIARFQELKKAPDEIGEVDGEIVDANAIETALRSVGVSLRDSTGQFRELDAVFLELSSKWDGLDKNTQRYIATIAAGSRQQSRFIAMMSDYGRTQDLVTAANNSAGASNRQYQKTLDSLETKINKLKNAWHEFTMGIIDSDLVKTGVDILTKFLEIVNKGTSAFDGMLGTITKIAGVLASFKLGSKIFEKIKQPLLGVFSWAAETAGLKGYETGKKYAEQVKKGAEDQIKIDEGIGKSGETKLEDSKSTDIREEEKGLGATLKDKTGYNELIQPLVDRRKARKNLKKSQQNANAKEAAFGAADFRWVAAMERFDAAAENQYNNPEEYQKALDEVMDAQDDYNKKLQENKQAQDELALSQDAFVQSGNVGFESLSQGLTKMGQSAVVAGSAISMIGGMISTLIPGGEKVGEVVSQIGQAVTVLGTALMAIPGIITAIQTILLMPPLGSILIILGAILAAVIAVIAVINNNSPEKKLEKAAEEAEKMAEAANNAAEAYDKLAGALDNLDDKYDTLNELTQGTKEWNKAVREINSSVLDLIDEYPELAKFVENKEGVLTIDMDDSEVQDVLQKAETQKIITQNASNLAKVEVSEAEAGVQFGEMEATKKVANKRGWDTFGDVLGGPGVGALLGVTGALGGAFGGSLVGGLVGTIVGAIAGPIEASKTATDDALQNAVSNLAEHVSEGGGTDFDSMFDYLHNTMKLSADEAEILAREFSEDLDSLTSYGETIHQIELQQKAVYSQIASSAQGMANTLNMTSEQIKQSSVLVDEDVSGGFYEKRLSELAGKDMKDLANDADIQSVIRETYGDSAKLDKNSGKVTYVKDGVNNEVTLSVDEVKRMVATSYATKESAKAIEYSDDAIRVAGEKLSSNAINALYSANEGSALTQADKDSLISSLGGLDIAKEWDLLSDSQKKQKTESEDGIPKEIQEAWGAMGDAQAAYGGNIVNFMNDLVDGVLIADEAFRDAGDAARDFMTADMAEGFKKKLDEVAGKAGGEEAYKKVQDATDKLLGAIVDETGNIARDAAGDVIYKTGDEAGALTDDQREAIQSRINMTDWTNQEQLLALQIELEQEYGFTEEAAKNYVKVLGDAAFATSALTTTVEVFGDFWKATEKINQSMQRLTALQWEYDRALKSGEGSIGNLVNEMLDEYKTQATEYENAYNASTEDLAKIYAQGGLNYKIDLRDFVELGDNGINVDETRLQDAINIGEITKDEASEWLEKLNEQYTNSQDQLQGLRDTLDNIEELEQQGEDAYYELRNMVKETILDTLQKQVDIQQETLDTTRDINTQIISKLQEQIDDARQERKNEEARQNIADLQSQQAYLSMDTSGANDLSILGLNEQIAQAEQDYQDSLIDQAIQELSDANEKAYEQREQQISLAQSQLDTYSRSEGFQKNIDSQLSTLLDGSNWESTALGKALQSKFTVGMSEDERNKWISEVGSSINLAKIWGDTNWETEKQQIINSIGAITTAITGLGDRIAGESSGKKVESQVTTLSGQGFDLSAAGVTITPGENNTTTITGTGENGAVKKSQELALDRMTQFAKNDAGKESEINSLHSSIQSKYARAKEYGMENEFSDFSAEQVMSQTEFYNAVSANVANGDKATVTIRGEETEVSSYTDYLSKINSRELTGIDNLSAKDAYGAIAVPGTIVGGANWNFKYEEGQYFDAVVDGTKDKYVKLGQKQGEIAAKYLDTVWNNTGSNDSPYVYVIGNEEGGNNPWTKSSQLYVREKTGSWWRVVDEKLDKNNKEWEPTELHNSARTYMDSQEGNKSYTKYKYETGGLADFTGPAWLDGTPSRPEYILNAAQTERFFSLVDVLEGFDDKKASTNNSNDISVDVDINVESIGSDYDVEQLANKIRSMLRDDAMYRNVNNINQVR